MGRFLRDAARMDKTRAGIILAASGKTLIFTSQQRIQIREPLVRLYKDIETFQYRAVVDTLETIDKMESARTAYRAGLLWMKDVSQKLDPDTYKQLEKFRRVQAHVRRSKGRFERLKLDTHQKIDMLSASRVNMFSHSLALYQRGWLNFFEKTSQTMNAVSEAFTGFQYFEFNILKELRDPSKKALDDANYKEMEEKLVKIFGEEGNVDKATLFGPEYKDSKEPEQEGSSHKTQEERRKKKDRKKHQRHHPPTATSSAPGTQESNLLDLDTSQADLLKDLAEGTESSNILSSLEDDKHKSHELVDILSACSTDEKELLTDIFTQNTPVSDLLTPEQSKPSTSSSSSLSSHLPSQLLSDFDKFGLNPTGTIQERPKPSPSSSQASSSKPMTRKKEAAPLDKWLNLFAEIDPLSNPDAIGRSPGDQQEDRNC